MPFYEKSAALLLHFFRKNYVVLLITASAGISLICCRRFILVWNMPVIVPTFLRVADPFALWCSLVFIALRANCDILRFLLTFLYVLTCHKKGLTVTQLT
jgi:hypothetical protein